MATPHITAELGDFTPAVLMPGDPRRAQHITKFLTDDARLVANAHGMLGFTRIVNGRPLSVMGSGTEQPSFTIYTAKLFSQLGVEQVVRVNTIGALSPKVKVGDVTVATGAHTDSSMNQLRIPSVNFNATAGFRLVSAAYQAPQLEGAQAGGAIHPGIVMPRDHFYFIPQGQIEALASYKVLGVEMETITLYGAATECGEQALAILTVSDHLLDYSSDMSVTERETHFTDSLRLVVAITHNWPAHDLRTYRPVRATRMTATPLKRGGHNSPRP